MRDIDYEFEPSCILAAIDSLISSCIDLPAFIAARSNAFCEMIAVSFLVLLVDDVLPEEACALLDEAAAA